MDHQQTQGAKRTYTKFSGADLALVRDQAAQGRGYKAAYKQFVTERHSGRKPWTLPGAKKVMSKLKKTGSTDRVPGSGDTRAVRIESIVDKVKKMIEERPATRHSSTRQAVKMP